MHFHCLEEGQVRNVHSTSLAVFCLGAQGKLFFEMTKLK